MEEVKPKMNQTEAIRLHLESGREITSMQAFSLYGCTILSDKIFNLRKRGYVIETIRHEGRTRYDTPCFYASYRLIEKPL